MNSLTFTKPDDWHLHLRDGVYLQTTAPLAAQRFARAIIMPNLKPPITTVAEAESYHQRILTAIPKSANFKPLMTLYLTPNTIPEIIQQAKASQLVVAVKLYPKGATTHAQHGIEQVAQIYPALEAMEMHDLPLLIHAESTDESIDVFDREQHFLDNSAAMLIKRFPRLRMVIEHISSAYAVSWILSAPKNIAATITAHHLLLQRNDVLVNGIYPHHYCLPVVKTRKDQAALIKAATSGNAKFFLGTDSAPHTKTKKEATCGAAGIFTGHAAIELYAEIFEQAKALDKLESFASFFGADFYGLPRNSEKITLVKESWRAPEILPFGNETVVPFRAGKDLTWKLKPNYKVS